MLRVVSKLSQVDDCLCRAQDQLDDETHTENGWLYVEKQVQIAHAALRRALDTLREIRWVDMVIAAHDCGASVLGGARIV